MFAIQPASFYRRDKELWAIGVFTSISHTQPVWAVVLKLKVLIIKSFPIDAFTWMDKWNILFEYQGSAW